MECLAPIVKQYTCELQDDIPGVNRIKSTIEIFDKTHPEIKGHIKNSGICFISFFKNSNSSGISISKGTIVKYELSKFRYASLQIKNSKLFILFSNENTNGFNLCNTKKQRIDGLKIVSHPLVLSLHKRFKMEYKKKYYLIEHEKNCLEILVK